MRNPDLELNIKKARGHVVYAWCRAEEWVYVGRSMWGLSRPFDQGHHVIGESEVVDLDRLLIWLCPDFESAKTLEKDLIREHKPRLNKVRFTGPLPRQRIRKDRCAHCGGPMPRQARRFCSLDCRLALPPLTE